MVTFEPINLRPIQNVKLGKKLIGTIYYIHDIEKYQYIPKGQKTGGEKFYSLLECKQSLLGD